MTNGVIIKVEHGLGAETVGVFVSMVGIGVMGPVLSKPRPFASSNQVGAKAEEVIDPRFFRGRSVIGIVLDVQSDPCTRDSECNGEKNSVGGAKVGRGGEGVLEEEKGGDVEEGTEEVSGGTEFAAAADDFEDFRFDFAFEGGVEFVAVLIIVFCLHCHCYEGNEDCQKWWKLG